MTNANNHDNAKNYDVVIAGTDFFADSETFLNELTDSELDQIRGGANGGITGILLENQSTATILLCELLGPI